MSKLIFLDIDGTLCFPNEDPSPRTAEAIRQARANGHKVFLATGRNWGNIPRPVFHLEYDGYILNAGAEARIDGQSILKISIPEDLLQKVLDLFHSLRIYYIMQCDNDTYCPAFDSFTPHPAYSQKSIDFILEMAKHFPLLDMGERTDQPGFKFNIYAPNREIYEQIFEALKSEFNFTVFDNLMDFQGLVCGELNYHKFDKGRAIEAVCQYYGTDIQDSIAFGDSTNDSAMIKAAGLGVAMGNAQDEVKAIADYICPDCREDGVAQTLEKLGII